MRIGAGRMIGFMDRASSSKWVLDFLNRKPAAEALLFSRVHDIQSGFENVE